ncbi:hypothetical protein H6P81_014075 [Aristolochia fimbriata]|uniref:Uncharacterized protein n=1 Tax=Aristolochia fimbriata TaxID=158543 RepID=A0AAV7EJS4_ARIFI|nr:hypothetical protein H6P81_014075 [Aristolochia fimbriata]
MASIVLAGFRRLWQHFSCKSDDLKASKELVGSLSIPHQTKEFVFAIRDPDSKAVIYILAAQNLSEQSAIDAEYLIEAVRPDAVVVQVDPYTVSEFQETNKSRVEELSTVPTSSLGVLKGCFLNKINKETYENLAGSQILQAIFGVSSYGHLLSAKWAANQVNSQFLLLESPLGDASGDQNNDSSPGSAFSSLFMHPSSLVPVNVSSVPAAKRFFRIDNLQGHMIRSLTSAMDLSIPKLSPTGNTQASLSGTANCLPPRHYEAPSFAQTIYPLLEDLHNIFIDLPTIRKALLYAQKILVDVGEGGTVDAAVLSEVHAFRIAVEGLRIAFNNDAQDPRNCYKSTGVEFSNLPSEEKSLALLALALKRQTKNFSTVVAIVDASCMSGIRKYWNSSLPEEIGNLAENCCIHEDREKDAGNSDKKSSLAKKSAVTVGASATAVFGASCLTKLVPVSTFLKVVTYQVPASLKLGLIHTQRTLAIALCKILSPSKFLAPGLAGSGSKASALKVAVSSEKIRAVAHSVIASAEKTSFQAMRTTFYEIMRRRGRTVGAKPWALFGCSVASCSGLLYYGDGIECAAMSVPSAPTIACIGRGLQSLHEASQAVRTVDGEKVQQSIKSLMYKLKKMNFN